VKVDSLTQNICFTAAIGQLVLVLESISIVQGTAVNGDLKVVIPQTLYMRMKFGI